MSLVIGGGALVLLGSWAVLSYDAVGMAGEEMRID